MALVISSETTNSRWNISKKLTEEIQNQVNIHYISTKQRQVGKKFNTENLPPSSMSRIWISVGSSLCSSKTVSSVTARVWNETKQSKLNFRKCNLLTYSAKSCQFLPVCPSWFIHICGSVGHVYTNNCWFSLAINCCWNKKVILSTPAVTYFPIAGTCFVPYCYIITFSYCWQDSQESVRQTLLGH